MVRVAGVATMASAVAAVVMGAVSARAPPCLPDDQRQVALREYRLPSTVDTVDGAHRAAVRGGPLCQDDESRGEGDSVHTERSRWAHRDNARFAELT